MLGLKLNHVSKRGHRLESSLVCTPKFSGYTAAQPSIWEIRETKKSDTVIKVKIIWNWVDYTTDTNIHTFGIALLRRLQNQAAGSLRLWCLTAPSHYMNKCGFIFSVVHWQSPQGHFTRCNSATNYQNLLAIIYMQFHSNNPWPMS